RRRFIAEVVAGAVLLKEQPRRRPVGGTQLREAPHVVRDIDGLTAATTLFQVRLDELLQRRQPERVLWRPQEGRQVGRAGGAPGLLKMIGQFQQALPLARREAWPLSAGASVHAARLLRMTADDKVAR